MRRLVETIYLYASKIVSYLTKEDPEKAYDFLTKVSKYLNKYRLDRFLLDDSINYTYTDIKISNAAGLNKNGEVPPKFLKYLGFDRVVIGTVTYEPWRGNPRPRVVRYEKYHSLINWIGLENAGIKKVINNLEKYKEEFEKESLPLTLSVAPTPSKKGKEMIRDIEALIRYSYAYGDRYELNVSCPNVEHSNQKKHPLYLQREYSKILSEILNVFDNNSDKDLYIKVAGDLFLEEVKVLMDIIERYNVKGVVCTNTASSSRLGIKVKGGISGRLLKEYSIKVQMYFKEEIEKRNLSIDIIACGGIESIGDLRRRISSGAKEIQIYTPLIFKGPKLIRELKEYLIRSQQKFKPLKMNE